MGVNLYTGSTYTPENTVAKLTFWAQLFEGELNLTQSLNPEAKL